MGLPHADFSLITHHPADPRSCPDGKAAAGSGGVHRAAPARLMLYPGAWGRPGVSRSLQEKAQPGPAGISNELSFKDVL